MNPRYDTTPNQDIATNTGRTLSLAVLSGKGGCGKTSIALNLALALQQEQNKVLLMDCDLGLANLDVMLGITPANTFQDVLLTDMELAEAVYPIMKNLDLLPASSGIPELVDMTKDMRDMLVRRLGPALAVYDYVFLDLGAGIHSTVQTFASMTMARLVVVTPEPTSLTDGYALMKVLSQAYGITDFLIVVNQVEHSTEEFTTFRRLHNACKQFLNFEPVLLGSIRQDSCMGESILRQQPLLTLFPACNAACDIVELARRLIASRDVLSETLWQKPVLEPLPM